MIEILMSFAILLIIVVQVISLMWLDRLDEKVRNLKRDKSSLGDHWHFLQNLLNEERPTSVKDAQDSPKV